MRFSSLFAVRNCQAELLDFVANPAVCLEFFPVSVRITGGKQVANKGKLTIFRMFCL